MKDSRKKQRRRERSRQRRERQKQNPQPQDAKGKVVQLADRFKKPTEEVMSPEERERHEASAATLVPGRYYSFSPAIEADAIAANGRNLGSRKFSVGWYIGRSPKDGPCIFQCPPDGEKHDYYFKVLFTGGVLCELTKKRA